jgi:cholesterol transport system auxiliary component
MKYLTLLFVLTVFGGCALLSKSEPMQTRYFTPESNRARPTIPASPGHFSLRLGNVHSSATLGSRILYRRSSHELGMYYDKRWTERPEEYLRRALSRVLFEERGIARVVSGPAPTLDVELVSFEEVRGEKPLARMQLVFVLSSDRLEHEEQTLTVEEPVNVAKGEDAMAAVVSALSRSLERGVDQLADRVTGGLAVLEPPPGKTTRGQISEAGDE